MLDSEMTSTASSPDMSMLHNGRGPSAKSLPSSCIELLERELTPIFAQLMTLPPGKDHHPDVLWLYEWLTQPDRSADEFRYAVVPLRQKVNDIMVYEFEQYTTGDDVYVLRAAAEAIAARNPVLEGDWEEIAWRLFLCNFDSRGSNKKYGRASKRFSNWVINVIGDPEMCPNPDLRIHMLQLYRTLVKIDNNNREQALESLMSATTFLDRHGGRDFIHNSKEVADCFKFFAKDDYLLNFAQKLVDKLKTNRHTKQQIILHDVVQSYGMGLKNVSQPTEIKSLISLLSFIHSGVFEEDILYESTDALYKTVKYFKAALEEPELIDTLVETIMTVLEAVINLSRDQGNGELSSRCLYNVNAMLDMFVDEFEEDDEAAAVDLTLVGQEIVSRYKNRISKIRTKISEGYPSLLQAMFFGKVKLGELLSDIIFNANWYNRYISNNLVSLIGHELD